MTIEESSGTGGEVLDLMAALNASVAAAKRRRRGTTKTAAKKKAPRKSA